MTTPGGRTRGRFALVGLGLLALGGASGFRLLDRPAQELQVTPAAATTQDAFATGYDAGKTYGGKLLADGKTVEEVTAYGSGACAYVAGELTGAWTQADAPHLQQGCVAGFLASVGREG